MKGIFPIDMLLQILIYLYYMKHIEV